MIVDTHEIALALADDLQHMRIVLSKSDLEHGDVRRLSAVLRRILIDNDGDLRKVAPPRIGRPLLPIPDLRPIYHAADQRPFAFFCAGVADLKKPGLDIWVSENDAPRPTIPGYKPALTTLVSVDTFLAQKVACYKGNWVARGDAVRYVANVANGVHSGVAERPGEKTLDRMRHIVEVSIKSDPPTIRFNDDIMEKSAKPSIIDRSALDIALVLMISTIRYLTLAPDIIRLESIIKNESI